MIRFVDFLFIILESIRFPDRTSAIGTLINSYLTSSSSLNDQTIHLLFSANRWEAAPSLENKLATGPNLVCDRDAFSGVAFSSAKGLDLDWCMSCDRGLPAPDAVIYLGALYLLVKLITVNALVQIFLLRMPQSEVSTEKNDTKRLTFNAR